MIQCRRSTLSANDTAHHTSWLLYTVTMLHTTHTKCFHTAVIHLMFQMHALTITCCCHTAAWLWLWHRVCVTLLSHHMTFLSQSAITYCSHAALQCLILAGHSVTIIHEWLQCSTSCSVNDFLSICSCTDHTCHITLQLYTAFLSCHIAQPVSVVTLRRC